jgi:hypothetical protein
MANNTSTTVPAKANSAADAKAARGERRLLSPAKVRLGLGMTGVLALGWAVGWWLTRPAQMEPKDQVVLALRLLDSGKFSRARAIAKNLDVQGYREPGFTGALEFIQGMATFHLAETAEPGTERSQFQAAITLLREAEQRALEKHRRPEWSFALGASLYRVGDVTQSRPLLEEDGIA